MIINPNKYSFMSPGENNDMMLSALMNSIWKTAQKLTFSSHNKTLKVAQKQPPEVFCKKKCY